MASTALGLVVRLPDTTVDVSPWNHWRVPAIVSDAAPGLEQGPVLVTVEYVVYSQNAKLFLRAMHRYGRVRRRDGASQWGVIRDVEQSNVYLETFVVSSEHLRQHGRSTRADRELEQRVHGYAGREPSVRHFIYVTSDSQVRPSPVVQDARTAKHDHLLARG